eukprot:2200300-Rhodomonas_salina.1
MYISARAKRLKPGTLVFQGGGHSSFSVQSAVFFWGGAYGMYICLRAKRLKPGRHGPSLWVGQLRGGGKGEEEEEGGEEGEGEGERRERARREEEESGGGSRREEEGWRG